MFCTAKPPWWLGGAHVGAQGLLRCRRSGSTAVDSDTLLILMAASGFHLPIDNYWSRLGS